MIPRKFDTRKEAPTTLKYERCASKNMGADWASAGATGQTPRARTTTRHGGRPSAIFISRDIRSARTKGDKFASAYPVTARRASESALLMDERKPELLRSRQTTPRS